jgi:hypothetical protein
LDSDHWKLQRWNYVPALNSSFMNSICLHRSSRSGSQLYCFHFVLNAVLVNHPVNAASVNEGPINCLLLGFVNNFVPSSDVRSETEAKPFKAHELNMSSLFFSCVACFWRHFVNCAVCNGRATVTGDLETCSREHPVQGTVWEYGKPWTAALRVEYKLVKLLDLETFFKTLWMYKAIPVTGLGGL